MKIISNKLIDVSDFKIKSEKVVLIYGDFNILHPGHLRFIRFAKDQGDYLLVGINDQFFSDGAYLSNEERISALSLVDLVDGICIIRNDLPKVLETVVPKILVKGSEWRNKANPESLLLKRLGIPLIFSSGERFTTTLSYRDQGEHTRDWLNTDSIESYVRRRACSQARLTELVTAFTDRKIAVMGDVIVDEYQECLPVGMSREDPTIVVTPQQLNRYLGGAGIVAAHASGLGATVDFFSVVGTDPAGEFAHSHLCEYGVSPYLLKDAIRPTTVKRRYRASGKTLLRVNDFLEQDLSDELNQRLIEDFSQRIQQYDLVVFSDFNYGFLSPKTVKQIMALCNEHKVPYVADSQSSSQVGDLAKFKNVLLATPTEHEARITTKDAQDGLITVSANLGEMLNAENLYVTLGAEGVLIRKRLASGEYDTDELPALNGNPKDVAGAGDAMLTSSSLALVSGANIWEAAILGSLASAYQVGREGNVPLQQASILQGIEYLFGK